MRVVVGNGPWMAWNLLLAAVPFVVATSVVRMLGRSAHDASVRVFRGRS